MVIRSIPVRAHAWAVQKVLGMKESFPQPCPLPPQVSRVWPPQRVRFQSFLQMFIAQKCKGSNETLTLNAALPGVGLLRRAGDCLRGVLQLDIFCGPPPSPFLPHYCVKLMQRTNIPPKLGTGKKLKLWDLESIVIFVLNPLWKVWWSLLMNNPKMILLFISLLSSLPP